MCERSSTGYPTFWERHQGEKVSLSPAEWPSGRVFQAFLGWWWPILFPLWNHTLDGPFSLSGPALMVNCVHLTTVPIACEKKKSANWRRAFRLWFSISILLFQQKATIWDFSRLEFPQFHHFAWKHHKKVQSVNEEKWVEAEQTLPLMWLKLKGKTYFQFQLSSFIYPLAEPAPSFAR